MRNIVDDTGYVEVRGRLLRVDELMKSRSSFLNLCGTCETSGLGRSIITQNYLTPNNAPILRNSTQYLSLA